MDQMMLNTMQGLMQNFVNGFQKGMEANRQRAIRQRQEAERRRRMLQQQIKEREREHREQERRHREEFDAARRRMLGELRGSGGSGSEVQGLPSLEVRETAGAFGTKTLKPRYLSRRESKSSTTRSARGWLARANCSAYLLKRSLRYWSDENFEEAAYLSNEAAALANGEKTSPDVVCPKMPDVADVKGEEVAEEKARAERFMKRTMLVSRLFSRAAAEMKGYRAVQRSIEEARQKVDKAEARMEEARGRKQEIEREQQEKAGAKKASVMKEALAALKKAKEALASSRKNLADARKEQEKMEESMKQTREMINAAQNDPESTDRLLEKLSKTSGVER